MAHGHFERYEMEKPAIGERGFLLRIFNNDNEEIIVFRVYKQNDPERGFVDYEITHHDCEIVIIDPSAALIRHEAGDFLDYTAEIMKVSK